MIQLRNYHFVFTLALACAVVPTWAGATDTSFDDDILDVRAGFDFAWTDDVHLLFSAATGLREPRGEDELDTIYILACSSFDSLSRASRIRLLGETTTIHRHRVAGHKRGLIRA